MPDEPQYHKYHSHTPPPIYVCDACGSLITDKRLHDEWHDYMVNLLMYRDQ